MAEHRRSMSASVSTRAAKIPTGEAQLPTGCSRKAGDDPPVFSNQLSTALRAAGDHVAVAVAIEIGGVDADGRVAAGGDRAGREHRRGGAVVLVPGDQAARGRQRVHVPVPIEVCREDRVRVVEARVDGALRPGGRMGAAVREPEDAIVRRVGGQDVRVVVAVQVRRMHRLGAHESRRDAAHREGRRDRAVVLVPLHPRALAQAADPVQVPVSVHVCHVHAHALASGERGLDPGGATLLVEDDPFLVEVGGEDVRVAVAVHVSRRHGDWALGGRCPRIASSIRAASPRRSRTSPPCCAAYSAVTASVSPSPSTSAATTPVEKLALVETRCSLNVTWERRP